MTSTDQSSGLLTYRYFNSFLVTGCSPSHGSTAGGTLVIVYGLSFVSSTSTMCRFGEVSVTARVVNSTAIECLSPTGVVGSVPLAVVMDGYSSPENVIFVYTEPPTISSLSPDKGFSAGGGQVTILGSNFSFNQEWKL
jgi:hypothetical protein